MRSSWQVGKVGLFLAPSGLSSQRLFVQFPEGEKETGVYTLRQNRQAEGDENRIFLDAVYSWRMDAQTCSARCRKAFSRSSKGRLERLKRLSRIE